MKKFLLILSGLIIGTAIMAQVPMGITHQAVIRDANNELLINQEVGIRVSILKGIPDSLQTMYVETHIATTNANGLLTFIIGKGQPEEGLFEELELAVEQIERVSVKIEVDPEGGTNYTIEGITQLYSVPYALHAKTAQGTIEDGKDFGEMLFWDGDEWATIKPPAEDTLTYMLTYTPSLERPPTFARIIDWMAIDLFAIIVPPYVVTGEYNCYTNSIVDFVKGRAVNPNPTRFNIIEKGFVWGETPTPELYDGDSFVWDEGGAGAGEYEHHGISVPVTGAPFYLRAYIKLQRLPDRRTDDYHSDFFVEYGDVIVIDCSDYPDFYCGDDITFTYRGEDVTYGTIEREGLCWMDRNLGATSVPGSSTDPEGYGDLFQWGRLDDGHQDRTSTTTSILSTTDVPGHGNFITVGSIPYDWRSPQNDDLWQGEDGVNNPCPPGWRVPTEDELTTERESWSSNNSDGAYASTLKWPVGGGRVSNGTLYNVGSSGRVWSSSVSGTNARYLYFYSGGAGMVSGGRAYGLSLRCVRLACDLPSAPEATDATGITTNTFTANWNDVPGAVTYTLEVALDSDFDSLDLELDVDATSYTVGGLSPTTTYYYRVSATNDCGTSEYSNIVSVTTTSDADFTCGDEITFTYREEDVTYGTIWRVDLCWMDRNLGAKDITTFDLADATGNTDTRLYGDLFQWGRLDDGHQDRTSTTTSILSTTDVPGHSDFITVSSSPWDWRDDNNNDRWNADPQQNNPCPPGWRVPTEDELNTERLSWDHNNSDGAWGSTLRWPVGGHRIFNGSLHVVDSYGNVWSSSVSDYRARSLYFFSSSAGMYNSYRASGFSVRCVRLACDLPSAPEATDATGINTNTFTANWNEVSGAVTYTLEVALYPDFDSLDLELDVDATSYTVGGLSPTTTYYYRVSATNDCGTSEYSNIVSVTTTTSDADFTCGDDIIFIYRDSPVTYGTIERSDLCWMDRNLGASRVPTEMNDEEGYGDLFQWGRLDDGHQDRTSTTTSTLSPTDVPGHSDFITVSSHPRDWRDDNNNDRWNADPQENNPCPDGWRVPTEGELNAEHLSWDHNNSGGAWLSTLKWPVGGGRSFHGTLNDVGSLGHVWSSSVSGAGARTLGFYSGSAGMGSDLRAFGMSVRCVRDL